MQANVRAVNPSIVRGDEREPSVELELVHVDVSQVSRNHDFTIRPSLLEHDFEGKRIDHRAHEVANGEARAHFLFDRYSAAIEDRDIPNQNSAGTSRFHSLNTHPASNVSKTMMDTMNSGTTCVCVLDL